MLHVTNGSSVSLPDSGLGGEILVWQDVLNHAPEPVHWNPDEEIVLWFEHDLYDQLQLIHILDSLRGRDPSPELICINRYLGRLRGDQLAALWPDRRPVTREQFDLASAAWNAFRAPDPMGIQALLETDTAALPFLAGALRRHLQQFPALENGLARTERQILELVRSGHRSFHALFRADQQLEERIFMGDTTFRGFLDGLTDCPHPLVHKFQLTSDGEDVLAGRKDHVRLNGIDRLLGGVHLQGKDVRWRWDQNAGRLTAMPY